MCNLMPRSLRLDCTHCIHDRPDGERLRTSVRFPDALSRLVISRNAKSSAESRMIGKAGNRCFNIAGNNFRLHAFLFVLQ